MRLRPGLGATNLALICIYLAPAWAVDALRALRSPYSGFEDRTLASAASAVRQTFDLGLNGLLQTASTLAAAKLVVSAALLAYGIEFARAIVVGREPDRGTLHIALLAAILGVAAWAVPALMTGDTAVLQRCATQLLMVAGAVVVLMLEQPAAEAKVLVDAPSRERPQPMMALTPVPANAGKR